MGIPSGGGSGSGRGTRIWQAVICVLNGNVWNVKCNAREEGDMRDGHTATETNSILLEVIKRGVRDERERGRRLLDEGCNYLGGNRWMDVGVTRRANDENYEQNNQRMYLALVNQTNQIKGNRTQSATNPYENSGTKASVKWESRREREREREIIDKQI